MLLVPEDLALQTIEIEELIESGALQSEDFQMGTYTNYIKGRRDNDL